MCILFLYVNDDPEDGQFQLIIGNNRDEHYERPTKPASEWDNAPYCIGGQDLQPGREGGTWFGVSTRGRIGALLNVLQPNGPDRNKRGRGLLVTEFLTTEQSAKDYCSPIVAQRHEYNDFNLVMLEKRTTWSLLYVNTELEKAQQLPTGIHCMSNSAKDKPWQKVVHGKEIFQKLVNQHNHITKKSQLEEKILVMLNDPRSYMPDRQLESQGGQHTQGAELKERSAVFVNSPQIMYGTRTNTVVLIDKDGNGEYIERTMAEPIQVDSITWNTKRIPFHFNSLEE